MAEMTKINFYESVNDDLLKFAVINWSCPLIQPGLVEEAKRRGFC